MSLQQTDIPTEVQKFEKITFDASLYDIIWIYHPPLFAF